MRRGASAVSPIAAEPFTERRAAALLRRVYDVFPAEVRLVAGGAESEVWRVEIEGESPLCLKWFRTAADAAVVQRSLLMDRLARRGLPCGAPIPSDCHAIRAQRPATQVGRERSGYPRRAVVSASSLGR